MTPFEKAGYTKDSKFRVTFSYCDFKEGDVVILRKDDGTHSPQFMLVNDPDVWEYMNLGEEVELIVEQDVSSNVYPNPPHKHAEIIKHWADGAKIEYRVSGSEWYPAPNPTWSEHREYRVKPQKSDKDIQIEKLEADLQVANIEMAKSYNSYMQSFNKTVEISDKIKELKSNV